MPYIIFLFVMVVGMIVSLYFLGKRHLDHKSTVLPTVSSWIFITLLVSGILLPLIVDDFTYL